MKIVVRNPVDPDLDADATKPLVRTLGKWKIGPNVLIRAVRVSSTGGLLVIESTLMNGSTRNRFRSDVIQLNDPRIYKNVILETAMPSICGNHQLGSLVPLQNVAARVLRNAHSPVLTAGPDPGFRVHIALKNSDPSAKDGVALHPVNSSYLSN